MPAVTVPATAPGTESWPVGLMTAVGCPGVATVVVEPDGDDRTPPVEVGMPPVTLTVEAGFCPATAATGIVVVAAPVAGGTGPSADGGMGVAPGATPLVGELPPVVPGDVNGGAWP